MKFNSITEKTKLDTLLHAIPIFLIIFNLLIKGFYLLENSIGFDEPFSIYHAQMDISSIINQLAKGNNPPLYELFIHFWIKLFGISPISVRIPSLIFSSITVYYIYKIGKKFYSFNIGLIASLLYTFSNYHIIYAHEARVYPLFAFLSVASMYYFLDIINTHNQQFKTYVKLIVINTLLCYSHYFGFFIIIVQTLVIVFDRNLFSFHIKNYLKYLFFFFILYIPNIKVLYQRFIISSSNGTWVSPPSGLSNLFDMLSIFSNKPVINVISTILLISTLIIYFIKRKKGHIKYKINPIVIWFLFPYLFMFFISYKIPMFLDRYLIFITIAFYILIAISAEFIFSFSKFKNFFLVIFVLLYVFTFSPKYFNKRPTEKIVNKTLELKNNNANSIIIISPKHYIFNYTYYYNDSIFKITFKQNPIDNLADLLEKDEVYAINDIEEIDLSGKKNIIYLDAAANFSYPNNNILPTLKNKYRLTENHNYNIYSVYLFQKN